MSEDFKDIFGDWEPSDDIPPEDVPSTDRPLNEKEVRVVGVFQHGDASGSGAGPQTFVLLQDRQERKVPIWIGRFEAFAIQTALQGEQLDRPMTHDLIRTILDRLGATLDSVIIDDLWQETFYAKLCVTLAGEHHDIDCRPSDAIAIAVRTKSPIFVAEAVFESVDPQR
ncbi:MAG: bifunctional nuclease family protein [Chthonomonadales bacterium]|nr:bifunctional nuclease family protein [Chthonomonadales bacterium]